MTEKMNAKELNGLFAILPPPSTGAKVAYHYHKDRESALFIISGTGNEIIDGKKVPIKAGDVLFILPGVNIRSRIIQTRKYDMWSSIPTRLWGPILSRLK